MKYFIEDRRNGKWLKFPKSFDDMMIDTRRSSEDEESRKWTNDPLQAMQFETFEEAEAHNKKYWNMADIEVTEHLFVPLPSKGQEVEAERKAKELVDKFINHAKAEKPPLPNRLYHAKQCALVCVDDEIDMLNRFLSYSGLEKNFYIVDEINDLQQVRTIIVNL